MKSITETALVLAPSRGLGGGIERYVAGICGGLRSAGVQVRRFDLVDAEHPLCLERRLQFSAAVIREVAKRPRPAVIVAAHPNLAPLAAVLSYQSRTSRFFVAFYGSDIWTVRSSTRRALEWAPQLRLLTISSFSAGALSRLGRTSVLPPGVNPRWFSLLRSASADRKPVSPDGDRIVLTVFRLAEWRNKGLPELLEALRTLEGLVPSTKLVVAGRGPAPPDLVASLHGQRTATLVSSPADADLANLYASADVLALCTRTRSRPPVTGEGFGLVLLEAQLAATPVVGPASGGSRDAYVEGLTGVTPADESPRALAEALYPLLRDPIHAADMGRWGAEWSARVFHPDAYARRVQAVLLPSGYALGSGSLCTTGAIADAPTEHEQWQGP